MSDRIVTGAVVLYETADDVIEATAEARGQGFTKLDVASPYPIHGIDEVLGSKRSPLGFVALAFGLLGVAIGKAAQWWMSAVDYPLNIGGKPLFSLPAFIPVVFEMMVLGASIAVVLALIAYFVGLPKYGGSLLDSEAVKKLTCDTFGIVVDAADPEFEEATIEEKLGGGKALSVEILSREPEPRFFREMVLPVNFLILLAGIVVFTAFATNIVWRYTGEVPPFNFMKWQTKLTPQEPSDLFADGKAMQQPVAGTVARGLIPYAFAENPEGAGQALANPIPLTQEAMDRGRAQYTTFCQPCHGPRGEASMTLTENYPSPPTLHSNKVREWSDGRIYHVITVGQNAMPSYASQISREDRWRIIHYVRALLRSRDAPERDIQ